MRKLAKWIGIAFAVLIVTAASATPADAAVIRAQTPAGAVKRLLAWNSYGPTRRVDCARLTRRYWACDWNAPFVGDFHFPCSGDASVTRSAASRTKWIVYAQVLDGDPLCF